MKKTNMILACLLMMLTANANAQSLWERFVDAVTGSKTITASDNIISKTISLSDFNALTVDGFIAVTYVQEEGTARPRVEISGPDNIVEVTRVEQKGNAVSVGYHPNVSVRLKKNNFQVRVYSSDIHRLVMDGSGELHFNKVKTNRLEVLLDGSGYVGGNGLAGSGEVSFTVSGSGHVEFDDVSGTALTLKVDGSGDISMKGIQSERLSAYVGGSGDIILSGNADKADYSLSGSGNIDANGLKAGSVNKSKRGSGEIIDYQMY